MASGPRARLPILIDPNGGAARLGRGSSASALEGLPLQLRGGARKLGCAGRLAADGADALGTSP